MGEKLQDEVNANFAAFQRILPELHRRDPNRWALMRRGTCVACYDTLRDAHTAARTQYDDGLFSVQKITATVVDLGWFSHAVH